MWQDARLCRHLHLPLQSGCEATLQRMQRKTTPEAFARLVETARKLIPDVAITTDVIVGFPGESERRIRREPGVCQGNRISPAGMCSATRRARARPPAAWMSRCRRRCAKERSRLDAGSAGRVG